MRRSGARAHVPFWREARAAGVEQGIAPAGPAPAPPRRRQSVPSSFIPRSLGFGNMNSVGHALTQEGEFPSWRDAACSVRLGDSRVDVALGACLAGAALALSPLAPPPAGAPCSASTNWRLACGSRRLGLAAIGHSPPSPCWHLACRCHSVSRTGACHMHTRNCSSEGSARALAHARGHAPLHSRMLEHPGRSAGRPQRHGTDPQPLGRCAL